jgi:hypothetical protein
MATEEIQKFAARRLDLLSGEIQKPLNKRFRDSYFESSDFESFDADDDWVVTNATSGTAEVIDGAGGILSLDAGAVTQHQGVQVQHKTETILPAADKDILFECQIEVTDTFDKAQLFLGLSVLDTTLMDSGLNTSTDHIGLEIPTTGAGVVDLVSEKGGVRGNQDTVHTLVEATFVILGFYVDGLNSVTPLINGLAGTPIETGGTHIPVTELAASFVCHADGTNDPIMGLDWYYVIQVR